MDRNWVVVVINDEEADRNTATDVYGPYDEPQAHAKEQELEEKLVRGCWQVFVSRLKED